MICVEKDIILSVACTNNTLWKIINKNIEIVWPLLQISGNTWQAGHGNN